MAIDITIRYTDPTSDPLKKQPFTISPGETNTNSTSLTLMGQGVANYAKYMNENLIELLEHSASPTAPPHPTIGQIWHDSVNNMPKVYKKNASGGYVWAPIGGVVVSPTPPAEHGVLWYDTSPADPLQYQLKIFNGITGVWTSVADRYVLKTGDTITGSIRTSVAGVGIQNIDGTSKFAPLTTYGTAVLGRTHTVIGIGTGSTALGSGNQFIIGAASVDPAVIQDASHRLFTVEDSGAVTIARNYLSMTNNRVINVADGINNLDVTNLQQLLAAKAALQILIDQNAAAIAVINSILPGKVNKAGDTMSGALIINNALTVSGLSALNGGLNVTGNIAATGNISGVNGSFTGPVALSSTLDVTGATSFYSTVRTIGALTALGVIQGQTMTMAGQVDIGGALNVSGALAVNAGATIQGMITQNQPMASITQPRHVTSKEYVDSKIQAIPLPAQTTGLWVGNTTLANIKATYTDLTAYPPGTVIAFDTNYNTSYGYGNGSAVATYATRCTAIRTTNAGWVLGTSSHVDQPAGIRMIATQ